MVDASVILDTLQLVADRHGDPTKRIYDRLFAAHPDLERLFDMDRDGGVRAEMVQVAFACILDQVGEKLTAPGVIVAARQHHDGYGVPDGRFDAIFDAMTDTFADILAEDWTFERDAHWRALMAEFAAMR